MSQTGSTGSLNQPNMNPMPQPGNTGTMPQSGNTGTMNRPMPQPGNTGTMNRPMPQQPAGQMYPQGGINMPDGSGKGPKKSHTGLVIGIISAVVAAVALVVVLFVWPGVLKKKDGDGKTSSKNTSEYVTERASEEKKSSADVTETQSEKPTETMTEEKTEERSEKQSQVTTEEPYDATEEVQAATEKKTEKKTEAKQDTSFKDYGMKTNLEQNKKKTITTCPANDKSLAVKATVEWTEYQSEAVSQEIIDFGKENNMKLSGYERKAVTLEIDFEASDVYDKNGADLQAWIDDWYNVDLFADSVERLTDSYDSTYYRGKIEVGGKKKWVYIWYDYSLQKNKRHATMKFTALVPAGYDGVVVGVSSAGVDSEKRIYEVYDKKNFLLLYMK
ncbi:MAG: hypothetical protein K5897_00800 [Eubacterium sp.]|nr:hypothetical protein [Eubacterium sp.]